MSLWIFVQCRCIYIYIYFCIKGDKGEKKIHGRSSLTYKTDHFWGVCLLYSEVKYLLAFEYKKKREREAYFSITLSSYPTYIFDRLFLLCLSEVMAFICVRITRLLYKGRGHHLSISFGLSLSCFALFIMIIISKKRTKKMNIKKRTMMVYFLFCSFEAIS